MGENILFCLCGLPYSGKSTWARHQRYPIVCPDDIRLALHGCEFIAEAEPMVWAIAKIMVNALFSAGHDTVILDATNITKERRDNWRSEGWATKFHVFNTDKATCLSRAAEVEHEAIYPIIESMDSKFESFDPEDDVTVH